MYNREQVTQGVRAVLFGIHDELEEEFVSNDAYPYLLGFDSLDVTELTMAVEKEFSIRLKDEVVASKRFDKVDGGTLQDFIDLVYDHMKEIGMIKEA